MRFSPLHVCLGKQPRKKAGQGKPSVSLSCRLLVQKREVSCFIRLMYCSFFVL